MIYNATLLNSMLTNSASVMYTKCSKKNNSLHKLQYFNNSTNNVHLQETVWHSVIIFQ